VRSEAPAAVTDTASLVQALLAVGARVSTAGQSAQPFMPVPGQLLQVDGASVQVFELADDATAAALCARIAPDASTIGPISIAWLAPPHFFRAGRSIVLYVGEDPRVLAELAGILGEPIARGQAKPEDAGEDVDDWVPTELAQAPLPAELAGARIRARGPSYASVPTGRRFLSPVSSRGGTLRSALPGPP